MSLRICLALVVCALPAAASGVLAQNRVRTETIRPSGTGQPIVQPGFGAIKFKADGHLARERPPPGETPEIITDPSRLPAAVARTRARILVAARSGNLHQLVAEMEMNEPPPVFSFSQEKAPITFWKGIYPDSEGVEVLAILLSILETGSVHVDAGTRQDVYLWPYFAQMPLKALSAQQKVELFRIVTGADYKGMLQFGAYSFYRLGIAPDGRWMFFVSGD